MLKHIKKAINIFRLIPTLITCTMLVFYTVYLGMNIKNGVGNTNVNIVFLITTAVSFILQILLYLKVVSGNTSRRLKRLCRIVKLLTNISALGVAIYSNSIASSWMSFLMLPAWVAQLTVELLTELIERVVYGTLRCFKPKKNK